MKTIRYALVILLTCAMPATMLADLQTNYGAVLPDLPTGLNMMGNNPGSPYTSFLMDASGEKVAFVFRAPKTGTLHLVSFRTGAVTTAEDVRVSFQDVDLTTGNPDGTADQYRVITSGNFSANSWLTTGILSDDGSDTGAKRSVTINDWVAIVIEPNSFSAFRGNINAFAGSARNQLNGMAYVTHFTAAWAKSNSVVANFALEYSDGSYGYIGGALPFSAVSTQAFNSGSNPDERALRINLPFKAKVFGAVITASVNNDADLVLYDGTSAQVTVALDKDTFQSGSNLTPFFVPFGQDVTLNANTTYYLSWKPGGSSTTVLLLDVHTANAWNQMAGGSGIYYGQRVDAGSWSDTTTRRIAAGLVFSAFSDDVGAGASGGTGRSFKQ